MGYACSTRKQTSKMADPRSGRYDAWLIDLDGTPNKARLGGNATIAVSMAVAHAYAAALGVPLWRALAGDRPVGLPLPEIQLFGGGAHAARRVEQVDATVVVQIAALAGVADAVFAEDVSEGDVVGPIKSAFGWHVVKVDGIETREGVSESQARTEAVAHARAHVEQVDGGYRVAVEPGLPSGLIELPQRPFDHLSMYFGGVAAATWSPASGFEVAGDPRRSGGTSIVPSG